MSDTHTIASGRFLSLVSRGGWEYATRNNASGVVAVIAVTDHDEIVLVEQHRPPLNGSVIELPAGLVGDEPGATDEDAVVAANRELLEETGFVVSDLKYAGDFASSAGLTDETVSFYIARGASRQSSGGGVDGEQITVHTVEIKGVHEWLAQHISSGVRVDAKVLAGLAILHMNI